MDEVHVADLADRRLERRVAGQHFAAALAAGDPAQSETCLIVGEEALDAHLAHHTVAYVIVHEVGSHAANSACSEAASRAAASCSRNVRSENICASSDRSPTASNRRDFDDASRASRIFAAGSSSAIWFIESGSSVSGRFVAQVQPPVEAAPAK